METPLPPGSPAQASAVERRAMGSIDRPLILRQKLQGGAEVGLQLGGPETPSSFLYYYLLIMKLFANEQL